MSLQFAVRRLLPPRRTRRHLARRRPLALSGPLALVLILTALLAGWGRAPLVPGGKAAPLMAPSLATPGALPRAVTWDAIDVTLELREDSSIRVTERDRVDFTGGPFSTGFREIPLARIERIDNIEVGEVEGGSYLPYVYVQPGEFSRDVPKTYTYQAVGPSIRIEWSFPLTTSDARTFEIAFDAHGALRVYDDVDPPYQQISWIGVGRELSEAAPVNNASLTIVLPRPVDPGRTLIQGPGGMVPEDHTEDGQTWVWEAHDLGRGDQFAAGLQFEPLVEASRPSWQDASDAPERGDEPRPAATSGPAATPVAALATLPADAYQAARLLTVAHLEAGTLAEGEAALAAILAEDPANVDAQLGLGVIRFMQAIEHLSQGLYTYGLKPPESFMVPVLRLPVPENPTPQPITYDGFRGLLQAYVDDLALAEATLAGVRADDVELILDLKTIRYDVDGDGNVTDDERFIAVVQHVSGMTDQEMPASLTFAFDTGDVLWLRAYCHVLMAFGEFLLAHDWQESFDASFFHLFPAMESPFRDALKPPGDEFNNEIAPIADFVSFLHIRWPVSEPARMGAVRTHLKQMVALSRESWEAIEAETDDDREWLPNARQTGPFATVPVDAERIAAWRQVLDEADAILDGEKLVPHWRFDQGVNLRRVFEEPRPFDLVLWVTGPAALPYLEDGPVSTPEEWARMTEAFEGSFGLFALWVN